MNENTKISEKIWEDRERGEKGGSISRIWKGFNEKFKGG